MPQIRLDEHQRDVLMSLVEATRRLRPDQRGGFLYSHAFPDPTPTMRLPGADQPVPISFADLEVLSRAGLIVVRRHDRSMGHVDITPEASRYYEAQKQSTEAQAGQIEQHIRMYLDSHAFRSRFTSAYDTWSRAADLLWGARFGVDSVDHRPSFARVPSTTDRVFLESLVTYWGTVSDLVQRQEHAGQKEGTPVSWDDARRVVFQTAVVMFECASTIPR